MNEIWKMTSHQIEESHFDKAILAIGSCEAHGRHLAEGCDTLVSYRLSCQVADRCEGTMVLPPIPYGYSGHYDTFPFTVIAPFLQLIKEAANDPAVISIKITIYRLASKTKLVEYLCAAAENGKDVMVLIELRARFDKQNNIDWSERLEEAGCNLIYGLEDYKVHSKIRLISRKERGEIKYLTQVGTGNYNEKTAGMYTDLSLLTANQEIGRDADTFFKNIGIGNLEGHYHHLLVAPVSLRKNQTSAEVWYHIAYQLVKHFSSIFAQAAKNLRKWSNINVNIK